MPHLSFEYSNGLETKADLTAFARHLRDAMLATGNFPLAGTRVRGHRCDISVIADESADFEFIHMVCDIGAGRDVTTRQAAAQKIYDEAEAWVAKYLGGEALALSLTLREMPPETSVKRYNTIRNHMAGGDA